MVRKDLTKMSGRTMRAAKRDLIWKLPWELEEAKHPLQNHWKGFPGPARNP